MRNVAFVIFLLMGYLAHGQKGSGTPFSLLADQLDTILTEDQRYRNEIGPMSHHFGPQSSEVKALWQKIHEIDSAHLKYVKELLDRYGWLGPKDIGNRGNLTLFLVIQHADRSTQEDYLPMMRQAAKAGNAKSEHLALLEDRVAIEQGRRQLYGSQIGLDSITRRYFVLPLEDPEHVDDRRKQVGLPPLSEYVSQWKISWDPIAYEKQLPFLESRLKKGPQSVQ